MWLAVVSVLAHTLAGLVPLPLGSDVLQHLGDLWLLPTLCFNCCFMYLAEGWGGFEEVSGMHRHFFSMTQSMYDSRVVCGFSEYCRFPFIFSIILWVREPLHCLWFHWYFQIRELLLQLIWIISVPQMFNVSKDYVNSYKQQLDIFKSRKEGA